MPPHQLRLRHAKSGLQVESPNSQGYDFLSLACWTCRPDQLCSGTLNLKLKTLHILLTLNFTRPLYAKPFQKCEGLYKVPRLGFLEALRAK